MNDIERVITDLNDQWRAGFRAGVQAAARIPDLWDNGRSCGVGGDPCEHIRMAYEIARRIRSLLNESGAGENGKR